MNYPLISEYIEAIKSAEDNFNELSYLRPILNDDGTPVMSAGDFSVVFKMEDQQNGKLYAVKCFTKDQEGRAKAYRQIEEELKNVDSSYLVSIRFLEKELIVATNQNDESEFPVLLMDWVDGMKLDAHLRRRLDNKYALEVIVYNFYQLAQWLIPQPFAHGDLKPDNILVREDGTLVLVDYDGMYVPAMKGQNARELGSPNFQNPLRTLNDFDEHIDDYALVSIYFSLLVISAQPHFLIEFKHIDRLFQYIKNFKEEHLLEPLIKHDALLKGFQGIITFFTDKQALSSFMTDIFYIHDLDCIVKNANTLRHQSDIDNAKIDEYGVLYSPDYERIIGTSNDLNYYQIKEGTKVICEGAFEYNTIKYVSIPNSIIHIGSYAFFDCENLLSLFIPYSVKDIGETPLWNCKKLESIVVEKNNSIYDSRNGCNAIIETFSNTLIVGCKNTHIPDSIKTIGESAFNSCEELETIIIPDSVTTIEEHAFSCCKKLTNMKISRSLKNIAQSAFSFTNLNRITLPESINSIGENAFEGCINLESIQIPNNIKVIANHTFSGCKKLNTIILPDSVSYIGDFAFSGCSSLTTIYIPSSVQYISTCALNGCDNLSIIIIPYGTKHIYENIFPDLKDLLYELKK